MRGLRRNFTDNEAFMLKNSAAIFALCETNLHDNIQDSDFQLPGYLQIHCKDVGHMHCLGVYAKSNLLIGGETILEDGKRVLFSFGSSTFYPLHSHTTDVAGLFCLEFAMAQYLTQIVDFPTHISNRDDHQPYLLDLFLCFNPDFCTVTSHPPLRKFDHMVVDVQFVVKSTNDILTIVLSTHTARRTVMG